MLHSFRVLPSRLRRRSPVSETETSETRQRKPPLGGRRGPWLWVAVGAIGLVAAWLAVGLGVRMAYGGKVLPHTRVAGVDLGGLTAARAHDRVVELAESRQAVTLTYRGDTFVVRGDEIGYRIRPDRTLERAMAAGREGPFRGVWSTPMALWTGPDLKPAYAVDQNRLDDAVADIADQVNQRPFHGALEIDQDSLRVRAEPPRDGKRVDQGATRSLILAHLPTRDHKPIPLPAHTPGVAADEVRAVARKAQNYLHAPLRLAVAGETVTVSPQRLASVLDVEPVETASGLDARLGTEHDRLSKLVANVADQVNRDPRDARIRADARPMVLDDKGDLTWKPRSAKVDVKPGKEGRILDRSDARSTLVEMIRSGDHRGELTMRDEKPRLTADAAREVDSVIGTFTTHHLCCEPRVTNIQKAARVIDGTVVMPGEKFSLNKAIGPRTAERGFVSAPAIADGQMIYDVGGGTSQLSTTLYNAVYFAGLEVHDHQPHTYYLDRYPPGREATIDYPTVDQLWTNDTDSPVLIRTSYTDTSISVTLYGDNRGRKVKAITESGGFYGGAVTVTRKITYPDGRVDRQPYTTVYQ